MALTAREFGESLMAEVRAGRSFGGHPLWFKTSLGMWWQFFEGMDARYGV